MQALYEAGKEIRQARESLRLAVWNGWSLARYTLFLGGGDTLTSPENERRYHEMLSAVSSEARKIAREYIQGWKSLLPVVVFRAGLYAKPMPSLVTGYRLGKPPASMQSTNHRDGGRENGVSCLIVKQEGEAITNSDRGYMETAKAFYGQGRIHKVFGYLNTVETGSDGEPLVVVLSHG